MNENDIIGFIRGVHGRLGESTAFMQKLRESAGGEDVIERAQNAVAALLGSVEEHFQQEERMMDMMQESEGLNDEMKHYIEEIRTDHFKLIKEFKAVQSIRPGAGETDDYLTRVSDLVSDLLSHAEKEDEKLFPSAEELLSDKQLKVLFDKID